MAHSYKHIDFDFPDSDWEGFDRSLETSLVEYGLIWSREADEDGDLRFWYMTKCDDKGETLEIDWGAIGANKTFRSEFSWVDDEDFASLLSCLGMTEEEFYAMSWPQQISEAVSYWGSENVFGTSYSEGWRLITSESGPKSFLAWAKTMEGFEDFWRGYLMGLVFTGSEESEGEDGEYESEPIVSGPGDIGDKITPEEVWGFLGDDEKQEVLGDLVPFFRSYRPLFEGREESAGSDFHLTRNGHGCGFWDGDWEEVAAADDESEGELWRAGDNVGEVLSEASRPYGTLELVKSGRTFYIHN